MFFLAQLPLPGFHVAHGKVVVAVQTLEGAAPRYFNGNLRRHTLAALSLVHIRAKLAVTQLFQISPNTSATKTAEQAESIACHGR